MMWEWHPAACFWTHRATCQNIQPVSATHLANTLDMIRMKIALPLQSQRTAEATSRHADVFSTQGWIRKTARHGILLATAVMLAACQPPMRLMPSPLAFTQGGKQLSADGVAARNAPEIPVFYATNRQILVEMQPPVYTIFPDDKLRMGTAHMRIGDGSLTWEEVNALSTSAEEGRRPQIKMKSLEEAVVFGKGRDQASSPAAQAYFAQINEALAQSRNKDLIIYVHGANKNMQRAIGQATQFQHFTGREAVVLTFVWPSGERVRRYFNDIRTARASIPAFTGLIELLAANTNARHIDVLAYSAGAEIASAGLAELGKPKPGETREALKQRLRLGQIYFAAPDADTRTFSDDIQHYVDLPERVSLSANLNDSALAFAQFRHRASRAGRPDIGELSADQSQFLIDASRKYGFDLIKIDPSVIPNMSRTSHGFWYTNAWVSNDVVATFVRRYPPQERGLDPQSTDSGVRYGIFPEDYDQRVAAILAQPATVQH